MIYRAQGQTWSTKYQYPDKVILAIQAAQKVFIKAEKAFTFVPTLLLCIIIWPLNGSVCNWVWHCQKIPPFQMHCFLYLHYASLVALTYGCLHLKRTWSLEGLIPKHQLINFVVFWLSLQYLRNSTGFSYDNYSESRQKLGPQILTNIAGSSIDVFGHGGTHSWGKVQRRVWGSTQGCY